MNKKNVTKASSREQIGKWTQATLIFIKKILRWRWLGVVIIAAATIGMFWNVIPKIATYNMDGDAMFNAWTLSRNHHCILLQGCPNYVDGNIFFPQKDTMLYSETQLSAGLLTLPLYFINDNPLFANNVWTILSMFFSGWFMYLLARRLSRGNEVFAIASGLVFEFAPYKMVGLVHLQNLSIFWLPLIILLIINYASKPRKRTLIGLLLACVMLFYASWYQMAFAIVAIVLTLLGIGLFKLAPWRRIGWLSATVVLAVLSTLPLALQYVQFSKESGAKYSLVDQTFYSSSVADYFIPSSTTLEGQWIHKADPDLVERYNSDSTSYHGFILYIAAAVVIILGIVYRKRDEVWRYVHRWSMIAGGLILAGVTMSLGPLLKLRDSISYSLPSGDRFIELAVPLPYIIVDVLLPQLSFIRAIGRSTVIVLFALCIILALLPLVLAKVRKKSLRIGIVVAILAVIFIELMPYRPLGITKNPYFNNMTIPAAYTYIRDTPEIDNIVVLAADNKYPGSKEEPKNKIPRITTFEQVMWAGYHNKNIFNGYSGYFPPGYNETLEDFIDFSKADIPKMQQLGIKYILVDTLLSTSDPTLDERVAEAAESSVYKDSRFVLVKISE